MHAPGREPVLTERYLYPERAYILAGVWMSETRKLQRMGHSTLVVSLPVEWIRRYGLRPRDKVELETLPDGSLKVRPRDGTHHPLKTQCTLHASRCENDELLLRLIIGAYLMGYDHIRVAGLREPQRTMLWDGLKMLSGLVLIDQNESTASLQCFVDIRKYTLSSLIRRMFMLIEEMHARLVDLLAGRNVPHQEELQRLGEESDRIYFLVVRQILSAQANPSVMAEVGVKVQQHLLGCRVIALALEDVADIYEELGAHASSLLSEGDGRGTGFIPLLQEREEWAWRCFSESVESVERGNVLQANSVIASAEEVHRAIEGDIRGMRRAEIDAGTAVNLHALLHGYRGVVRWGDLLAKLTINRALAGTENAGGYVSITSIPGFVPPGRTPLRRPV